MEESKENHTTEDIMDAIRARFEALPQDIQQAITGSDYDKKIVEVGYKHKMNIEQISKLEMETTMVMLGIIHPDDYAKNLKESLNVFSDEEIKGIVEDVNERILKDIKERLKEIWAEEESVRMAYDPNNVPVELAGIKFEKSATTPELNVATPVKDMDKKDEKIFSQAGIEIKNQEIAMPTPAEKEKIDTRQQLLKDIMNPPKVSASLGKEEPKAPTPVAAPAVSATPVMKAPTTPAPGVSPFLSGQLGKATGTTIDNKATIVDIKPPEAKRTADPYREPTE